MTSPNTDTLSGDKVKHAAHRVAHDLKSATEAQADSVKDAAADHVDALADAASAARDELPDDTMVDPIMDRAVNALGQAANHLRNSDIGSLTREVGEFARRNPALALGGAALVGFAAARFLKAGSARNATTSQTDPWTNHLDNA